MLKRVGFSVIVLVVTFVLQKLIAFTSRGPNASRWGREDYLLWPEWLASGIIAFGAFYVQKAQAHAALSLSQVSGFFFAAFMLLVVPAIVREVGYDPDPPHHLLTWQGIVVPNLLATLAVGVAVGAGVDLSN